MYTPIRRAEVRQRIRHRVRRKVSGTAERPRIAVFRSARHIYVQAIDDEQGRTVASASTREERVREQVPGGGNLAAAQAVGTLLAERLKQSGIARAVFDRGGYLFHGRVKALADAARSGGVEF